MKKRGQVSPFIIIGIVLVVIVAFVGFILYQTYNLGNDKTEAAVVPQQVRPIYDYIQDCSYNVLLEGVKLIGLTGGYVVEMPESVETDFSNVGYGFFEGRKVFPSKNIIENQIALYIEVMMPVCFDATLFPDFEISYEEPKVDVRINEGNVEAVVDYNVKATKEDLTFDLNDDYNAEVDINLGSIYGEIDNILNDINSNPRLINLGLLLDSGYEVAVLTKENNIFVYTITDESSSIDGVPYTFMFGVKL